MTIKQKVLEYLSLYRPGVYINIDWICNAVGQRKSKVYEALADLLEDEIVERKLFKYSGQRATYAYTLRKIP